MSSAKFIYCAALVMLEFFASKECKFLFRQTDGEERNEQMPFQFDVYNTLKECNRILTQAHLYNVQFSLDLFTISDRPMTDTRILFSTLFFKGVHSLRRIRHFNCKYSAPILCFVSIGIQSLM